MSNEFYINIFRDAEGKLCTHEGAIHTSIWDAARDAEEYGADGEYEHTVTHKGIKNLRPHFSEEYHERVARDIDTDRRIDEMKEGRAA